VIGIPDPDPGVKKAPDPGSGSATLFVGIRIQLLLYQAKIVRKTLILYEFSSLKNDINVPSKSNQQKN
jgi:hypothetical protein